MAFLVPACGRLSDHVGRRPVLLSAAVSTIVLAVPVFLLLEHKEVWSILFGLGLLAYPTTAYVGNLAASLPAIFSTRCRYGGMGIAYNIAVALFGGTAAFILEALVASTGSPPGARLLADGDLRGGPRGDLRAQGDGPPPPARLHAGRGQPGGGRRAGRDPGGEPRPRCLRDLRDRAPAHLVDTEPTVEEALAEVEVAQAWEDKARVRLDRATRATTEALRALDEARKRESASPDSSGARSRPAPSESDPVPN
ncbi:MFS transporter [Actinomyces gaoshouyii]|uniref:MFS transporter n=1 Tax=Actinomyces gaoshouyii TaxID=1960083 RepID=UPI001F0B1FD3|nr:MFS transporter [Actinomyces gaoshouyii]